MATTVVGGASLAADGKTWQDSEGRPLEGAALSAAKANLKEQSDAKAEAERVRVLAEHAQNPIAAALAAAMAPKPTRAEPKKD